MTLHHERWATWMKLGLALVYPPAFRQAMDEIAAATRLTEIAAKHVAEAAEEVQAVARSLRKDGQPSMGSELAETVQRVASAL